MTDAPLFASNWVRSTNSGLLHTTFLGSRSSSLKAVDKAIEVCGTKEWNVESINNLNIAWEHYQEDRTKRYKGKMNRKYVSRSGHNAHGDFDELEKFLKDWNVKQEEKFKEMVVPLTLPAATKRRTFHSVSKQIANRAVILRNNQKMMEQKHRAMIRTMVIDRNQINSQLTTSVNTTVTQVLQKYFVVSERLDQAMNDVEALIAAAKDEQKKIEAFKKQVATGLFNAVAKLAPPPISFAAALLSRAMTVALDATIYVPVGLGREELIETIKDSAKVDFGNKVLEAARDKALENIKDTTTISNLGSGVITNVASMMVKLNLQAVQEMRSYLDTVIVQNKLGLGTYTGRAADLNAAYPLSSFTAKMKNHLPIPKLAYESPAVKPYFEDLNTYNADTVMATHVNDDLEKEAEIAANLQIELDKVLELASPNFEDGDLLQKYLTIYLYAIAKRADITSDKGKLATLQESEIEFLKKLGVITTEPKDAKPSDKGIKLPMFYGHTGRFGASNTGWQGSVTDRFVVLSTLIRFAGEHVNPFASIYSINGLADVETALNTLYQEQFKVGNEEVRSVSQWFGERSAKKAAAEKEIQKHV
jgi:hypothetical protein